MSNWLADDHAGREAAARIVAVTHDKDEVLKHLDTPLAELLAAHPGIGLNWYIAEAVLEKRSFGRQLEWLREQCQDKGRLGIYELGDLLRQFRHESSRQEFMAFYIEARKAAQSQAVN